MDKYEQYIQVSKKYLWPHVLGPFAVLVLIQYLQVLSSVVVGLTISWLLLLFTGFLLGMYVAGCTRLNASSPMAELTKLRLFTAIPTIAWGYQLIVWVLSEESRPPDAR